MLGQQQMVFDVEQARGLVGALDIAAELVEVPALVAVERALGDAGMGLAGFLDHREQAGEPAGRQIGRLDRASGGCRTR